MTTPYPLDHLVYAVTDLEAAIDEFEILLGVQPIVGGVHPTRGTKNALVNLSDGAYLELIAIDPQNTEVPAPRWMGVDFLSKPQLTRWAITSTNLAEDSQHLAAYRPALAEVQPGSRRTAQGALLQWELSVPLPDPEVEVVPFLIDWRASDHHPSDALPNSGCSCLEIWAAHPQPNLVEPTLQKLGIELRMETGAAALHARIACPKGEVIL